MLKDFKQCLTDAAILTLIFPELLFILIVWIGLCMVEWVEEVAEVFATDK